MDYNELIATRIKNLCDLRGISINKLATWSGLRQSTINSILHGDTKHPQLITIIKIANGFGMTPAEFLDFKELNEYIPDDEKNL